MDIYILKNFTLKEVYFGLTEDNPRDAVQKHKSDPESPVGHWNFEQEEIKWGKVEQDISEQFAQAYVQALRREPQDEGWIIVMGMD